MRQTLILIFLLWCVGASGANPFFRDFWLTEAATPIRINDIYQDATGYIWLATEDGIFRFNGRRFIRISGTENTMVTALSGAGNRIVAGYSDGRMVAVQDNQVYPIRFRGAKMTSAITSVMTDGSGLLWTGTESQGMFVFINGYGINLNASDGLSDNFVYSIALCGPDKTVLLATDQGINLVAGIALPPHIERITTSNGLPDNIARTLKWAPGTKDFWIGTEDGGLGLLKLIDTGKKYAIVPIKQQWAWGRVNDILPVAPGKCWVGTEQGYILEVKIYGDSLVAEPYILPGRKIKKLLMDKCGNIWCGTNQGLTLFTGAYANYIKAAPLYSLSGITSMAADHRQILWYSLNNDLYAQPLNGESPAFKAMTTPATISSLWADSRHRLWIGTLGSGLWCRDEKGKISQVNNVPELKNGQILDVNGGAGKLWVCSLNGVEELSLPEQGSLPDHLKHYSKESGMGSDYIYQLFPDNRGKLWLATDGAGICLYDKSGFHHWDSSSGFTSHVVYSILEDDWGIMWAGTLNKGLLRYNKHRWERLGTEQGLEDIHISAMGACGHGQVVVVNKKGIDIWYPVSRSFRHFNRRLSLDIDSTSSVLNCIAQTTDNNVIVPFEHGFILFRKNDAVRDIRPSVALSSLTLFFKQVLPGRESFSAEENHLTFNFDGISYSNSERLFYRYRLDGYSEGWVQTSDESVTFPQLPPGKYTFTVQASLTSQFLQSAAAHYTFTIATPFYKNAWFIILVTFIVIAIVYAVLKVRDNNLRKVALLQRERMIFEYEHLKSQINPHFLFNSLNTLAHLIEEDKENAMEYTVHLSDLYRNTLTYHNLDLVTIKEEMDMLNKYFYIQKTRFGEALQLEVVIPPDVMQHAGVVPLALQLLVENAIKHNIVSRSKPLTIKIFIANGQIIVTNPMQPKVSKERGAGLGIKNIEKRYSLLTKTPVSYGVHGDEFIVILPLL